MYFLILWYTKPIVYFFYMIYRTFFRLVTVLCFFLVSGGVLAQTTTGAAQIEADLLGQNLEVNAETGEVLDISLEGIVVEEPTGIPTPWRMLWKRLQDQVVILATLDPVKRAEKRLQFAEERRHLAEFILENTDNPQLLLRAKRLAESAEKLFERLEKTKGDWTKLSGERVERLMRNAAVHQVRRERLFDRLEAELPEDQADIVRELRAQGLERGMRLLNAINNENIPSEIREHLRDVRERIQEHQGEVREYQQRRRALQESARQGDEVARQALQDLREERHERVQERVEERQDQQAAVRPQLEEVKARLRAAAQAGNEDAARVLRQIEEVEARARVQARARAGQEQQAGRPEERREVREEVQPSPAAADQPAPQQPERDASNSNAGRVQKVRREDLPIPSPRLRLLPDSSQDNAPSPAPAPSEEPAQPTPSARLQPGRLDLDIRGGVELRPIDQPQAPEQPVQDQPASQEGARLPLLERVFDRIIPSLPQPAPAPSAATTSQKKKRTDRGLVPLRTTTSTRSPGSVLELQPIQPRVELPRINLGF